MALYEYQAYTKSGKRVRATIDASSAAQARELIMRQGLYVTSIDLTQNGERKFTLRSLLSRPVSQKDCILFTKQLAILLKSGIPLLQSCELLIEQFQGRMRALIVSVRDSLKEGRSFADSLQRYPQVFENLYIQLVRAGEESGNLEVILERLTAYLERRQEIKGRVMAALRYPLIQLVVALGASSLLLTVVVPQMVSGLLSQGRELPTPTAIVLAVSSFLTGHYLLLLILVVSIIGGFSYWKSTPWGRLQYDSLKLKLPLVSYISRIGAVVQFSYTLSMLLEGGVHLAQALDIVIKVVDNKVLVQKLEEARDEIIKEGRIADYLEKTGMFPLIASYLIRTGENSGQLDTMLMTVAQNYEKEFAEKIDQLTGLISPIMLLVMAVIVGFIVLAVMLPMAEMGEAFQ